MGAINNLEDVVVALMLICSVAAALRRARPRCWTGNVLSVGVAKGDESDASMTQEHLE